MGHGPVGLPQTDEPEETSVGIAIEAGAWAIRARDREPKFSDEEDPARRHGGTGSVGNRFAWRCDDDAFCIQGSRKLPRPFRGSRTGRTGVRGGPPNETTRAFDRASSPGPAPRPERREDGEDGLRRGAGKGLRNDPPSRVQGVRRIRPGVRSSVASSMDPSSFEATPVTGRLELRPRRGARGRLSLGPEARGAVRFGGEGEAHRGLSGSAGRPNGRARSGAEGATHNATWVGPSTAAAGRSVRPPVKSERWRASGQRQSSVPGDFIAGGVRAG